MSLFFKAQGDFALGVPVQYEAPSNYVSPAYGAVPQSGAPSQYAFFFSGARSQSGGRVMCSQCGQTVDDGSQFCGSCG